MQTQPYSAQPKREIVSSRPSQGVAGPVEGRQTNQCRQNRTYSRRRRLRKTTRFRGSRSRLSRSARLLQRSRNIRARLTIVRASERTLSASPARARPRARDIPARPWQDVGIWSSDMDHQLSLFVRKYCFDFAKASKALRSYVQHVREPPPQRAAADTMRPACCRCACALRAPSPGARPR